MQEVHATDLLLQFPPQYAAISEQHQPAELIPQFSTIEYTLTVCICWLLNRINSCILSIDCNIYIVDLNLK